MPTIFIPTEDDFRKWIKEAVKECLLEAANPEALTNVRPATAHEEPLLSRKETAAIFAVSLVTLHDWTGHGLPCIRQGGRVYFLRSEVMDYVKRNRRPRAGSNPHAADN
jgi:Helix-turn-helix domain